MAKWTDPIPALKRRVADEILVLTNGWSQQFAASFMHVARSRVSDIRRGHLERMTLDRLVRCLTRLDREVELHTRRAPGLSVHQHSSVDGYSPPPARPRRARGEGNSG